MIEETKPVWSQTRTNWQRPEPALNRFLGGSPLSVALRLFLLSIIVGALLMWFDIRPIDLVQGLLRFVHRIWSLGFEALHEMGDYLLAGAMIVVPLWFVARLLSVRGR
ncbi:MAG TPA: DUF6460 domain-containing protein [Methylovirgula sp.]|nr:DUF6460 domain-containing protein [Methylovirgula sp.]